MESVSNYNGRNITRSTYGGSRRVVPHHPHYMYLQTVLASLVLSDSRYWLSGFNPSVADGTGWRDNFVRSHESHAAGICTSRSLPPRYVHHVRDRLRLRAAHADGGSHGGGPQRDRRLVMRGPRHSTLFEARTRLDRSRFSRPNTHFLKAFFKIYKKITFSRANSANFC